MGIRAVFPSIHSGPYDADIARWLINSARIDCEGIRIPDKTTGESATITRNPDRPVFRYSIFLT